MKYNTYATIYVLEMRIEYESNAFPGAVDIYSGFLSEYDLNGDYIIVDKKFDRAQIINDLTDLVNVSGTLGNFASHYGVRILVRLDNGVEELVAKRIKFKLRKLDIKLRNKDILKTMEVVPVAKQREDQSETQGT